MGLRDDAVAVGVGDVGSRRHGGQTSPPPPPPRPASLTGRRSQSLRTLQADHVGNGANLKLPSFSRDPFSLFFPRQTFFPLLPYPKPSRHHFTDGKTGTM